MLGIRKKRKFGIIINPFAANNRDDPGAVAKRYEKITKSIKPAIWLSNRFDDIYDIAEEFKKGKFKYLVISGGNGSFHHIVSRFKTVYKGGEIPPILLLKTGNMDTIADSINLIGNDNDILERFVKAVRKKSNISLLKRNLIKVEDKYCTIFGAGGLVSKFMDMYYSMGEYTPQNAFEVLTTFMTLFRNPASKEAKEIFAPFKAKITIDGDHWKKKENLGCIGMTIPSIGLGFTPGSMTLEAEDKFQFICSALKPMDFATQIFRFYVGKKLDDPNHFDDLVESVIIESNSPFEYTMDGEMYDAIYELRISLSRTGVELIYV